MGWHAIQDNNVLTANPVPIDWHSGLSIYASEEFLKAVGDEYGWFGGFDRNGKLKCVLPYTIVKKAFLRMARFRVETIAVARDIDVEEEKAFLSDVVYKLRDLGADMVIPPTTNAVFRTFPNGAVAAPYGTYVIDLTQPEDTLWGNLSSSHRRKVRLAMKQGIILESGPEQLDVAYQLVSGTFKRSQQPFMDLQAFKRYILSLGQQVRIMVATHEGVPQACVVIPFSNYSAYYVYGGSIPEPAAGATTLLHWEAMLWLRQLGVRVYDFCGVRIQPDQGSKQEGLMTFKERFGGRLVRGYMWKYSFNPLKFGAYRLAVRLQRGGDVVDQERHKLGRV